MLMDYSVTIISTGFDDETREISREFLSDDAACGTTAHDYEIKCIIHKAIIAVNLSQYSILGIRTLVKKGRRMKACFLRNINRRYCLALPLLCEMLSDIVAAIRNQ
jgi:hypothetical protein